jgi:DNA-binding NtrC family response regulator
MMAESDVIDVRDLPSQIQVERPAETTAGEAQLSMEQATRLHAQRVLAHVGGNKVRAAEILGISRTYLYELLKKSVPDQDQQDSDSEPAEQKLTAPKTPNNA